MRDFDAVVVGAGNAGLTAALTLQQSGLRTLLVERHNVPGGTGTSFRRGRFEFEAALHQLSGIGMPQAPGPLYSVLDRLGVAEKIDFVHEQEIYRMLVPGSHDVTVPADWGLAVEALEEAFRGNRSRLERFFELVRQVTFWQVAAMRGLGEDQLDPVLFEHGLRTVAEVLDRHFTDPGLKSALAAYWPYLGVPPSQLAFQDFAMTLFAYLEFKPAHIRGGSQAMSMAILDTFLDAGGTVRFNTGVEQILTDSAGVTGVRLDDGSLISTYDVVSNASLPATYSMLEDPPAGVVGDMGRRRLGISAFVMHLGLNATAADLGFTASTNVISRVVDHEVLARNWNSMEPALGVWATCYDVVPIGFSPAGGSHLSLLSMQYGDLWQRVSPHDYHAAKFAYADALLDNVELMAPGLRDAIEEVDVATPLTLARYLGHPGGAIYGFRQDRADNWLFRDLERDSGVNGLHVTGSWSGMGGFEPALESGNRVARRVARARVA